MDYLFIDLETYSSRDLKTVGLYKYVEDPEFEVLICGYAFNHEPVAVVDLVNGEVEIGQNASQFKGKGIQTVSDVMNEMLTEYQEAQQQLMQMSS